MSRALLYQPADRWQIWAAFGGAALIHFAAVALAQKPMVIEPPVVSESTEITGFDTTIDPPEQPDISELEIPPAPNPPDTTFVEEVPTPSPVKRLMRPVQPIGRQVVAPTGRATSMSAAKVFALSAPRPVYPYEARRQHATGSGIAVLTVDSSTGYVTDVTMAQTTGNGILDSATVSAFRRWRFKPGTVKTVRTPITFELNGPTF